MSVRSVASAVLAVAVLLAGEAFGCTTLVVVDDYTFDTDPCGPHPVECTGGHEVVFAISGSDITRIDAGGHRDGFDLDGTDAAICGQADFVSQAGAGAIDNKMAEILELYEMLVMGNTLADSRARILAGNDLEVIVLSHVDDLANDDCIQVTERPAALPVGMTAADLDVDHDGVLDAGLTLDYLAAGAQDPTGCAIDGQIHARFPAVVRVLPGTEIEATGDRGRLRLSADPAGFGTGLLGGSLRLSELTSLPAAVVEFLRTRADLDPSSRSARDCTSISFAISIDLVPALLGELRNR